MNALRIERERLLSQVPKSGKHIGVSWSEVYKAQPRPSAAPPENLRVTVTL